ncbi:hypothetical protein NLG97_g6237 [Lecanicillium saksenae]|uniref:Uncharacterized protein n=1 Tax=Lecanicillium saksenae TaxID=468837 RepID=A0ACC1QTD7_9HYPO|nr:hypothetical protein NLG97_g6237 [Lecanicillium saksenae]
MDKKRLLFLTNAELGQANVHIAVIEWFQKYKPEVELHLCSFASLRSMVTAAGDTRDPALSSVTFHEISGPTWKECLFHRPEHKWQETCALPPTARMASRAASVMPRVALPWNGEELTDLTLQVKDIVDSVDPDLIIVDNLFTPAVTVCYNVETPWTSSFIPYPVPFYMLPIAFYHQRQWRSCPPSTWVHENAVHLWEKTKIYYSDWGRISYDPPKNLKIFLPSSSFVDFPFSNVPDHIVSCGPIVRSAAPIEEHDPSLASWLRRQPTVYINLGTHVMYDDDTNWQLAGAIKSLLEEATARKMDVQVLWKVNRDKGKNTSDFSDLYQSIGCINGDDRVLIVDWLLPEPMSVLRSGSVVCSVNHGGANSYFEAVSAGVPQIVLPVWFDTYDFARRVEYFGIGKIGNYGSAPKCAKEELAHILAQVVLGDSAKKMREKAAMMAAECAVNGSGCEMAARGILNLVMGIEKK